MRKYIVSLAAALCLGGWAQAQTCLPAEWAYKVKNEAFSHF